MPRAIYHEGLTVESDDAIPALKIEGRRVAVQGSSDGLFSYAERPEVRAQTLDQLADAIIESSPELQDERRKIREEHLQELKKGVDEWNKWRRRNPATRPILYGADLRKEFCGLDHLRSVDFANANLIGADLSGMDLTGANFHEANLGHANLSHATLDEANFCRTDLYGTNLAYATLHRANLQGTQMAMTDLRGAELIECTIYGTAAWDLKLEAAVQRELVIVYQQEKATGEWEESKIIVDGLEAAQFVYLLLANPRIRSAVDTITSKVVLILGRFTEERKSVLDKIREELRRRRYVPIVVDFNQPKSRDVSDTVTLLAQMARFVIVDLTDPSSSPYELQRVYDATKVPVQSIILDGHPLFSMFWDLKNASPDRVLAPFRYRDKDHLMESLDGDVISPSLVAADALQQARERTARERVAFESADQGT